MDSQTISSILRIASSDEEIVSFFNFCCEVHNLANCKQPAGDIKVFAGVLDNYLKDPTKT